MIRQSLSPACHALIKELSPAPEALIRRCRSFDWAIQDRAGERIHIEFDLADSERELAAGLAASAPAALALIGAMLLSLAVSLGERSVLFDALVLWP